MDHPCNTCGSPTDEIFDRAAHASSAQSVRAQARLAERLAEFNDTKLDDGRRFYDEDTLVSLFGEADADHVLTSVEHILKVLAGSGRSGSACPICKGPVVRMVPVGGGPSRLVAEGASPALRAAFKGLLTMTALKRPRGFSRANPMYAPGDEQQPIMSEAFLYTLLGKEDARTVRARLRRLAEAAGFPEIRNIRARGRPMALAMGRATVGANMPIPMKMAMAPSPTSWMAGFVSPRARAAIPSTAMMVPMTIRRRDDSPCSPR